MNSLFYLRTFASEISFMDTIACLVIIFCSSITGWFISWILIKGLFWPIKSVNIAGIRLQGIIPAKQGYLAEKIGSSFQSAFTAYKGLDEKFSNPVLLEKLRPEIEVHIDHFLKEKLKTVFPVLAPFLGDKTLNQFKTAFLSEIDTLLPVLISKYMSEMKKEIKLDHIISERINALSMETLKDTFHQNMKIEIRNFILVCTIIGLLSGIMTSFVLFFIIN